jgi:hypothetical protein
MNTTMVASEVKALPPVASSIQDIPLEKIRESKTNPRTQFDPSKLAELAENIRQYGVLQPILVRPLPETNRQQPSPISRGGPEEVHLKKNRRSPSTASPSSHDSRQNFLKFSSAIFRPVSQIPCRNTLEHVGVRADSSWAILFWREVFFRTARSGQGRVVKVRFVRARTPETCAAGGRAAKSCQAQDNAALCERGRILNHP